MMSADFGSVMRHRIPHCNFKGFQSGVLVIAQICVLEVRARACGSDQGHARSVPGSSVHWDPHAHAHLRHMRPPNTSDWSKIGILDSHIRSYVEYVGI